MGVIRYSRSASRPECPVSTLANHLVIGARPPFPQAHHGPQMRDALALDGGVSRRDFNEHGPIGINLIYLISPSQYWRSNTACHAN